ncbi:MAG: hypothetical protein IV105_22390 [Rhizobacter sp.]|nr:hypothetical protein [Rhizobacter sp.]
MAIKRMTKGDMPQSLGTYNPVGHVLVALPSDALAQEARQALRDIGFDDEDVLHYTADEEGSQMDYMLSHASELSGFGYEVTLMRRYRTLAHEGCGWLLVYAPDTPHTERVTEVARRFGARSAVKYHRFVVEDLL